MYRAQRNQMPGLDSLYIMALRRRCEEAASLQVVLEPLEGARIGVLGRVPDLGVLVVAAQRPAVRLQQ